ncbi:hypothetical protein PAPYR_4311 [Paratrimastix pyriformis]|uniref:Endoplasmic reticulum transmembrane protein n=1 Tax=Paratrimastix pyriformis TaxID=342808 RepID=A0ABQ8US69_9EUKA|nr:hypothetical protein PAPYR_4311 [Paratrimastix pyriformis]
MISTFSLIWYIVIIELVLWCLLAFLPGAAGARIGRASERLLAIPHVKWVASVLFAVLSLVFLSSLNDTRIAAANKARKMAMGIVSASDHLQLNNILFRAQRNAYLSGMVLILAVILWRTTQLIQRQSEASHSTRTTVQVIREKPETSSDPKKAL